MSDWHFGMDYDMWLYPPVDYMGHDYNYELPEPIEAANIEGTLLVNAEDAICQVRRLQSENERLREVVRQIYPGAKAFLQLGVQLGCNDTLSYDLELQMRGLGIEVDDV